MKPNKTEAIGLLFVLIAFGWQIFEEELNILSGNTDKYQLHEKIDAIWNINSAIYTHSEFNKSGAIADINYPHIAEKWKDWEKLKSEKELVDSQGKYFGIIRIIIFAIGSMLIIYAKYKEK